MTQNSSETHIQTSAVNEALQFALKPDADRRKALAEQLGIVAIKKLTFDGMLRPTGAKDLTLTAKLGSTVVQSCVVTGDPVTTRIDDEVMRSYVDGLPEPDLAEAEMPDDENADPLPDTLDLIEVMAEALALSLPDWPRAPGVEPVDISVTEPGKTPMTDDDAKPFAALKSLTNLTDNKDQD